MRKALIAVITAAVLFAVGAFAADFALTAEDTASGTDAVDACTDTVTVEFTEDFDEATNNWLVDSVDLTIASGHTCEGAAVTIILQDNDTSETVVDTIEGTWPAGTTLSLDPNVTLPVGSVWNAAVLFDGQNVRQTT